VSLTSDWTVDLARTGTEHEAGFPGGESREEATRKGRTSGGWADTACGNIAALKACMKGRDP